MSTPYLGEIKLFAGNFAPAGWKFCNGELLAISEYDALFNLIGTTYGGDGQTTFALPNLSGRVPVHQGSGFVIGQQAGVESVTLTVGQLPAHNHSLIASLSNANNSPSNALLAKPTSFDLYDPAASPNSAMSPSAIGSAGWSQPHENRQPFLCVNFIISLFGVYPSQT